MQTFTDYNDLGEKVWKDSIFTLLTELRSKFPGLFDDKNPGATLHDDFVEVVIPTKHQMMMEELVDLLEKKMALHVLFASKQNLGKTYKSAVYSTPEEVSMFLIHLGSEQFGIVEEMTVHFFDSEELMLLALQRALQNMTRVPAEVLEYQKMNEVLAYFF